jgi:HK97 family phage major capsid protein
MAFATEAEYHAACDRLGAANKELLDLTALTSGDEPREWTGDEQVRAETLHGECEQLEPKVEAHRAKKEAGQKIRTAAAARQESLDTTSRGRQTEPPKIQAPDLILSGDGANQLTVDQFAMVRRAGTLRAFTGPTAHYDAYASGQWWLCRLGEGKVKANALKWCQEHLAQSTGDNSKGGVLVPMQFETAIIDLQEKYGVARREFDNMPMESDTLDIPRRIGGPTAYFVGENTNITESDVTWDDVKLTAQKIGSMSRISSELSEDAIVSVADKLAREYATAFAKLEDECGFIGDGSSTYGGVSGLITQCAAATASTVTAATGNTAYSSLDQVDFESMIGLLPDYAEDNAKWYIHKVGFAASMMRLMDAAGGNTSAMLAAGVGRQYLGYPVVTVNVMNSTVAAQTSTNGLCYLGDLTMAATLGRRRGLRTIVSNEGEEFMRKDQTGIQATQRFAMNVHDVGDTSTAGPVIMLATPAS